MKKPKQKTKKKSGPNPWIVHLKEFAKKHPELKYSDAMSEAKKSYNK